MKSHQALPHYSEILLCSDSLEFRFLWYQELEWCRLPQHWQNQEQEVLEVQGPQARQFPSKACLMVG